MPVLIVSIKMKCWRRLKKRKMVPSQCLPSQTYSIPLSLETESTTLSQSIAPSGISSAAVPMANKLQWRQPSETTPTSDTWIMKQNSDRNTSNQYYPSDPIQLHGENSHSGSIADDALSESQFNTPVEESDISVPPPYPSMPTTITPAVTVTENGDFPCPTNLLAHRLNEHHTDSMSPPVTAERRASQYSSSSLHTRGSYNDTTFVNQDNADIPPNETAPAIYCGECPIPEFMTPITTLSDVTSAGVRYVDAANDFTLDVPEGAVPETERLTLDVAVALFGPFQFPEGLRPVSPVFWVCVRDQRSFFFPRPVSVTLPHFLDLGSEEDVKSLGLTFLKASHSKNSEGMYEFSKTDGEMDFESSHRFGVLKTSHFCSLCIASRDRPECLRMTQFCLTSLLPRSTVSVGKKQYAYFFVTFYNLNTCLRKVDKLIEKKELGEYEKRQVKFTFKKIKKNHVALEMIITEPKHGKLGVIGKKEVSFLEETMFAIKVYH